MDAFAGLGFIAFFFVGFAIWLLPTIFFLLTLQRALTKCAPANRTMTPGLVWLQIIPLFGLIWQFFVVIAVANSLENEFAARRIPAEPKPGQTLGLAMCITRACTLIPFVNIFAGIAALVLWIVYWVKIAGLSGRLDYAPDGGYPTPGYGPGYGQGYGPGYPGQPGVGAAPYQGAIQPPPPYLAGPQAAAPTAIAAAQSPAAEAMALPEGAASESEGVLDETTAASTAAGETCATCGASLAEGTAFCAQCGAKVG